MSERKERVLGAREMFAGSLAAMGGDQHVAQTMKVVGEERMKRAENSFVAKASKGSSKKMRNVMGEAQNKKEMEIQKRREILAGLNTPKEISQKDKGFEY